MLFDCVQACEIQMLDDNEYRGGRPAGTKWRSDIIKMLGEGAKFMKYGRRGSPHQRVVWVSGDLQYVCYGTTHGNARQDSMIPVSQISQILKGCDTPVFRRCYPDENGIAHALHNGIESALHMHCMGVSCHCIAWGMVHAWGFHASACMHACMHEGLTPGWVICSSDLFNCRRKVCWGLVWLMQHLASLAWHGISMAWQQHLASLAWRVAHLAACRPVKSRREVLLSGCSWRWRGPHSGSGGLF